MLNDEEFYIFEIQTMLSNLKVVSWKFCFDCRVTVEESHNSVGSAVTRSTEIKVYPLYPFSLLKRDEENQPLTPRERDEATDLLTASAERLAREEFRR